MVEMWMSDSKQTYSKQGEGNKEEYIFPLVSFSFPHRTSERRKVLTSNFLKNVIASH